MNRNPSPPKNVLFVAYEFPPRGEAGVQRSAKFAKYLPDFGYNPLVLTAAESEIDASTLHRDSTLMRDVEQVTVFPCRGSERFVMRIPNKVELLRRVVKFCLIPDMHVLAWLPAAKRVARQIAKQHRIDAIYTSVCPFSSALLGRKLKEMLGVPWIVDFRDPWIDESSRFWPTKLHYWIEQRQERRVIQSADAVVVVTPTMKEFLVRRYPQWADKVHMIPNGFDSADFPPRKEPTPHSRLRIGYTGKLFDYDREVVRGSWGAFSKFWFRYVAYRPSSVDFSTHSPYYLLHAVRRLLDQRPELQDKILLTFAGNFGEKNRELVVELGLEDVVCCKGYVPHAESVQVLMDSDVLFLPLMSPSNGERSHIYTGKIFEYLAADRPILAAVPPGDAADLITQISAGWCVNPRDTAAIQSLLEELIEKKTAGTLHNTNRDEQPVAQFERRVLTGKLAALLDSLLK